MHNERLTLATLCGGAVQEKMDRALEKVAKNILDPNTDPDKKRSITLKITMKPSENDNEDVEVTADVNVSLAPEIGVKTRFFVNKDLRSDRVTIMEHGKGEIRGQLDFSDLGITLEQEIENEIQADEDDPEAVVETEKVADVIDFRRKQA